MFVFAVASSVLSSESLFISMFTTSSGNTIEHLLCGYLRACVPMFLILSGYGINEVYNKAENTGWISL